MHTTWFRNVKNKEERKKELLSYRNAFDALREVLEREVKKEPVRDYSPGWAEKQIAVNEWNAAIQHIINLTMISKEEK